MERIKNNEQKINDNNSLIMKLKIRKKVNAQ